MNLFIPLTESNHHRLDFRTNKRVSSLPDELLSLGITTEMVNACSLPCHQEATELVDSGTDIFGRAQKMTPETLNAWRKMVTSAKIDGIELQLVSAYRSIEYQCDLIKGKIREGRTIEDILRSNAIPGYSEHHTGRAIDLHSGNTLPLNEDFENTPAFAWLNDNASKFNFVLSYPRENTLAIKYEPWHWCYQI